MRARIVHHLESSNLLCKHQHVITRGRICRTQLLAHVDNIIQNLITGADTDVIYLDFAKAFDKVDHQVASWAIVGMHPPINPIRSRWIRPAPGPLWTHLLEVPLLDQKELDLGHDKTDLKSSGSAIILFYLAVCQPDHIYTRYVPCISFIKRSCIFNI